MFDIVLGCLTTIFACTWISVHPNVPPPDQSYLALVWRRLRMMLVAVIAPELIVGFAARQFFVARKFSKDYDVPNSHGFFFSMGGFVSQSGHPIATKAQIEHPVLGPQYLASIRKIKKADIMDKSKGDALSKGVALVQGLWFTTQCLVRVFQRLPITELEITTLAFAVINIFTRVLWWGKPLDVQQPIQVGPGELRQDGGPGISSLNLLDRFSGVWAGYYPGYNPAESTSVPSFWSAEDNAAYGARTAFVMAECLVGTVFGAIHCAAWKAHFPSADEMWMWRTCSLLVTTIPLVVPLWGVLRFLITTKSRGYDTVVAATLLAGTPTYIIARLFLIILPFTTLRALPPDEFTDVDWRVYIPHL
ncbi:hypothetical protein B0H17DRAFT_1128772 [Mycena rosella]|uniref:Uncharacterized protein n=1 Tax=Mycena rosella TaxID=1033263 RepID=A0AAD7GQ13_MYCRO|nr:hypothetical protein B0H17DRAFT_1128772 [Mycena rosella]